jgi:hypothetical protein
MDWMKIVNIKNAIYGDVEALHSSVHYCAVTYTASCKTNIVFLDSDIFLMIFWNGHYPANVTLKHACLATKVNNTYEHFTM